MNCEQYTRIDLETFHDKGWYQRIVDFVRRRNSLSPEITGGWPGNPEESPAVSRYPNLAGELTAPDLTAYIGNVARAAGVRPRTIASAIEQGTTLQPYQLERLAAALHVSVEYLSDPCFAVVDPSTDIGAIQTMRFGALLEDTKGLVVPMIDTIRVDYKGLSEGRIVTYVSYRSNIRILLIAKRHPFPNSLKPRGGNAVLHIDSHTSSWEAIEA